MQNFARFTKVAAAGTFFWAAQKVQNGDPKAAETKQTELCPERLLDAMLFCLRQKNVESRRYAGKEFPDGIPDARSSRRYAGLKMVFCINKRLDLDAVVGKSFGTEFGTDAPLDAMLVLCINKK